MTAARLDRKTTLGKLLQKHADWVECRKLRDYQMPELVRKKAAEQGRRFAPEALELFCHRSGTDLRRVYGEMDKLFQFLGERKNITVEDIVNSSSEGGEASIFSLLNALGRRELPAAMVCLQEQLEEKAAPPFILTMIARHFRQLWILRSLRAQGLEKTVIAKQAGINRYFYGAMQTQAQNYPAEKLRQIFELLLETDRSLKSSSSGGAPVLENLILKIIQ
jgi:DNA polymerase-3 subunit delta